jgi:hypothetical protein
MKCQGLLNHHLIPNLLFSHRFSPSPVKQSNARYQIVDSTPRQELTNPQKERSTLNSLTSLKEETVTTTEDPEYEYYYEYVYEEDLPDYQDVTSNTPSTSKTPQTTYSKTPQTTYSKTPLTTYSNTPQTTYQTMTERIPASSSSRKPPPRSSEPPLTASNGNQIFVPFFKDSLRTAECHAAWETM